MRLPVIIRRALDSFGRRPILVEILSARIDAMSIELANLRGSLRVAIVERDRLRTENERQRDVITRLLVRVRGHEGSPLDDD